MSKRKNGTNDEKTGRTTAVKRNRPLSAVKREGIITTAGKLFIRNGYHAVSMDMIAAAVPVSKPTLYNHFSNKEALYRAVMESRCALLSELFDEALKDKTDIRATFNRIGVHFLDVVLSPQSVGMYRVMIGASGDFPELGRIFYEAGPRKLQAMLIDYLTTLDKAGTLKVAEPKLSALCFVNMIKGNVQMKALLGLPKLPGPKARAQIVRHAVEIFLKGHGFKA